MMKWILADTKSGPVQDTAQMRLRLKNKFLSVKDLSCKISSAVDKLVAAGCAEIINKQAKGPSKNFRHG